MKNRLRQAVAHGMGYIYDVFMYFRYIANSTNMEDDTDPPIVWRLVELTLNLNQFTVPSQGFEAGAF